MQKIKFSSNKPYLFRSIFEWLLDNNATPYILVDTNKKDVEVPQEHIKDNQIVLNITPSAVKSWHVDNTAISFNARFSGVAREIYVPMSALLAVYAQENGLGMAFPAQEDELLEQSEPLEKKNIDQEVDNNLSSNKGEPSNKDEPSKVKKLNHLKIIK